VGVGQNLPLEGGLHQKIAWAWRNGYSDPQKSSHVESVRQPPVADAFWARPGRRQPKDFGSQGSIPSHPELLDWLATTFRDSGGTSRRMQKSIVDVVDLPAKLGRR
jgi:hypothetical protein